MRFIQLLILSSSLFNPLFAQSTTDSIQGQNIQEKPFLKVDLGKDRTIEFVQFIQLWSMYSIDYAGSDKQSRNDIFIRRGRFGAIGYARKQLYYSFNFAFDNLGKDKNTSSPGIPNLGDNRDFFPLDVFLTWQKSIHFNLTAGYFRPQVGKESMTSPIYMPSMEKALPNVQPRFFIVGRNTGREAGLNLGGIHLGNKWSIGYNLGIFDPSHELIVGEGNRWAPLTTGRVTFTVGDPELQKYKIQYAQSYYGKRNGTTLGLNASHQGKTDLFNRNTFYGIDILSNYGPIDFNAEYDWMSRNSYTDVRPCTTIDKVYSIKLAYNHYLKNGWALQAAVAHSGEVADDVGDAAHLNSYTGSNDQTINDVGINWLIYQDRAKFGIHYIFGKLEEKKPDNEFSYATAVFQILF
ncbi:MAG TPA: porin [Cytophagaceae bacterium]|jgi:hypothetical protein